MKQLGDIQTIKNAPFVDCITFGSPCQDLSIAGKRAGLAGERSGLFMEAVRIIKEMEEQSGGLYPTFAIWENVPGAFSSNKGRDFQTVLEELAKIKEPEVSIPQSDKWANAGFICGNGWSIAWRTLDAQFWGVPQRRCRIAVVMDFGGQRAGEILFERTGVSGNPEPSIPPWKGIARNPAHCATGHDRVVEGAGDCLTPWDVLQSPSIPRLPQDTFRLVNAPEWAGVRTEILLTRCRPDTSTLFAVCSTTKAGRALTWRTE